MRKGKKTEMPVCDVGIAMKALALYVEAIAVVVGKWQRLKDQSSVT